MKFNLRYMDNQFLRSKVYARFAWSVWFKLVTYIMYETWLPDFSLMLLLVNQNVGHAKLLRLCLRVCSDYRLCTALYCLLSMSLGVRLFHRVFDFQPIHLTRI